MNCCDFQCIEDGFSMVCANPYNESAKHYEQDTEKNFDHRCKFIDGHICTNKEARREAAETAQRLAGEYIVNEINETVRSK